MEIDISKIDRNKKQMSKVDMGIKWEKIGDEQEINKELKRKINTEIRKSKGK